MRNTFIDNLKTAAELDRRIHLLVGDLGFSVVEKFQEESPLQFHNIGVAEQNMIGVAAGMSHHGLKPFCYSISNFLLFRPAEFVRNLIDYHCLDVSLVSVGGGLAYGNLGYTHHAVQDLSFVNSLLHFTTCAPSDPSQVSYVLNYCLKNNSPKYVRLNRNGEIQIEWNEFSIESLKVFSNQRQFNKERSIILTTGIAGAFVENYLLNSYVLQSKFPRCHVNVPIWGNKFSGQIKEFLSQFDEIFVFEDHISHGGFGDWIKNLVKTSCVLKYSLVEDYVGQVGTQEFFFDSFLSDLEARHD